MNHRRSKTWFPANSNGLLYPIPEEQKFKFKGNIFKKRETGCQRSFNNSISGQGSQYVGMVKDLLKFPMVKDLFELANYILQYDLLKLCLEGPKSQLDQTKYCQPAIMVSSLAAIERLKEEATNGYRKLCWNCRLQFGRANCPGICWCD